LRYGRGWHHRLDRKVVAVRKALHEWESELGKLSLYPLLEVDDLEDGISIVKKKRLRLVHPDVQIVSKMLAILRERRPRCLNPESQRSYERAIVDWSKKEPVSGYMVGLFWFFHHECRCKVGDSEERTALIRNHFWKGLARAVKLNREYYYDDAKGCNAVRLAVDRNDNRSLP
jgi:hypothetical protein